MEAVTNILTFKSPHFPITNKCCFCVSARRGAIIYGFSNLVLKLISLTLLILMLIAAGTEEENTIPSWSLNSEVQLPFNLISITVDIILTVKLLIGVQKKRKELLKIYIYASLFYNFIMICMSIAYFGTNNLPQIIVEALLLGFNFYMLFVVYNVVYILEEEATRAADVQYVTYRDQQGL